MANLDPAVRKETGYIACWTGALSLVMEAVFLILGKWDLSVLLGNLSGAAVAVGNFFWMAITVQKVASIEDEERARRTMGVSYRYRTMLQFLWVILAIVVPVFNLVAGIVPLFIPSCTIKLRGILSAGKGG